MNKSITEYFKIGSAIAVVAFAMIFTYSAVGYVSDAFYVASAASPECSSCDDDGGGSGGTSFGGGWGLLELSISREFTAIDGGGGGGGGYTPYCTLTLSVGPVQSHSYPPQQQYILAWNAPLATSFTINNGIGAVTPPTGGTKTFTTSGTPGVYTGTAVTPYGTVNCQTQQLPPPPTPPICTLDLTQNKLTWTTDYAFQVLIKPLTNSPEIPGFVAGGQSQNIQHTETEAYLSAMVIGDLAASGINLPAVQGNTGFAGDQATMNRVCALIDGAGSTATTFNAEGYSSPSNNAVVKWNGSSWTRISASSFNSHLRYSFTCAKPGSTGTYPLNGSHTFVPPLGYGTHTYQLTATGNGGTVQCEDTITITPPTPTCELTATPGYIIEGDSASLAWVTTNATTVSIDNGIGAVTPVASGSKIVKPTSSKHYKATVTGPGGTVECTAKVVVTPQPPQGECKLEISKTQSKNSAAPGEEIEYTLNFKNTGAKKCTGSGVQVVDTLDPLLTYKSETHSTNITAGYQSDPVYKSSDRTVRFNAWDLDPGETAWAKIKVKVGTPTSCTTTVANKAKITSYEYNNFQTFVSSNETSLAVEKDCYEPPAKECKMKIEKTANVSTTTAGSYVEYTVTFKNIGTKDCTGGGVHVMDTLDSMLTYKSETHSSNVTAGYQSDPVYKSSTRTVHFNAATLTPGEEGWVKIKTQVGTPSSCSVAVPNAAKITAYEYDNFTRFETSNTVTVAVEKDCTPPPAAPVCTLSGSPSSVVKGESATLNWTTTNATTVSIDNGIGAVSPVSAGSKVVTPTVNTTYTLTATGPGGTVTCEKKIKVTTPPGECKLTITKEADKEDAVEGDIVEYKLVFKNIGTKDCTGGGVKIWDVLDSRLTYKSETHSSNVTAGYGGDPVYKSSDRTVRFNAATLNPGEEGWAKIKVQVKKPAACSETVPNKAKITAYEYNNFQNFEESNTVNLQTAKDCNIPTPYCDMAIAPSTINLGDSAVLSWDSDHVTQVTIDKGIGSVALDGSKTVSPTADTTYTGTFTGPGGTITCIARIEVETPSPTPMCTISASASKIRTGESVFISWTSQNVTQGFITMVGTTSPVVAGSSEVFPAENTTFIGTFSGPHGSVTCSVPVTVEKGGGGCQGNCGGGLNQPNIVMLQKPPEAPLAFVTLEQIPYTGFAAGKTLTVAFWLAIGVLAALSTYFVMGRGGFQFALGNALTVVGFGNYSAYDEEEDVMSHRLPSTIEPPQVREEKNAYSASVAAAPVYTAPVYTPAYTAPVAAPKAEQRAVDGIPELTDVIEARAHGAGVLMSPEAVVMARELSTDRGEALRMFGEILNEAIRVLPREDGWIMLTSERFEDLAGRAPAPVTLATPTQTPSVEAILASTMQAPVPEVKATNVEMPMADTDDQSVVISLARAILTGNRDQAYATVRNLETAGANVASIMTIAAGAFDQLYRARRHGTTTDLSIAGLEISDETLVKMVEIFTHGMDAHYSNAFTSLKLAVAQAFEARG